MGRETRRVPLNFDWPINQVWPGFMCGICDEAITYCMKKRGSEPTLDEICETCRRFGRLAELPVENGWPRTKINPPKGDGWQLWETVTEGSPQSPVFATPEELAAWLVEPGNDTSITKGTSYNNWLRMIQAGWAPSLVYSGDGLQSGVEAVGQGKLGD